MKAFTLTSTGFPSHYYHHRSPPPKSQPPQNTLNNRFVETGRLASWRVINEALPVLIMGKTDDHRLPLGSGSLIDLIITFKFYEHVSWLELRPTGPAMWWRPAGHVPFRFLIVMIVCASVQHRNRPLSLPLPRRPRPPTNKPPVCNSVEHTRSMIVAS